ncbi:DUF1292 domain-containing protein [Thalassobacillus sp. C254]|uniref:DUF1292 domain-containing protein n=1 Tax=Thalassobacillus sp. C254 TaxID=1225341 RepID=UPI0006D12B4C|nr:DUF1292 domain-containing protein [Thalassobacillus sp. C254]
MAEENKTIAVTDDEGNEHLLDILFTFDLEQTGHSYMVLTSAGEQQDEEEEEEEEIEVYAFRYEEKDGEDAEQALYPIESDEEWDMVEEMIETLSAEDQI